MRLADSHMTRLADPALRGYVVLVAASLAVMFAVQFDSGSLAAAGVPLLCGIAGLVLRWTAMPAVLLVTLGYFLILPYGIPLGLPARSFIRDSYLRFDDLLLAAALCTYLVSQYRLFDLTDPVDPRPAASQQRGELLRIAIGVTAFAVAGQALWWLVSNLEPHFGADWPLRWKPLVSQRVRRGVAPSTQDDWVSRSLMLILIIAAAAGLLRFAYWYLRLAMLSPLEARLILIDVSWREHRRELARQETWRAGALGTDRSRRGNPDAAFRWIVRSVVLLILAVFLGFILYVYFHDWGHIAMSVWLREILGWLLLGCGLAVFFIAYREINERRLFNALPICFIGYVVFRGGMHLIKVATAARAARNL